jgi:hypothetical protein
MQSAAATGTNPIAQIPKNVVVKPERAFAKIEALQQ